MDDQLSEAEARRLTFLRRLVTVLTAVMIGGIVLIVALLAIRLNTPPAPAFPDELALPEGTVPTAVTRGDGFIAVVTEDSRILILDPTGSRVTQDITIRPSQ